VSAFRVKGINHLGFVVKDLDATLKQWEPLFGVKAEIKENPDLHVRLGAITLGNIRFVFNESTQAGSRWEKYLEANGEGLEHVAFEIDDMEAAGEHARTTGLELRFGQHKPMHGFLTNFVEGMHGVDVELMGPEK
jgi:methylmalonyl-CoA/ethylmalonyl-CoA epimerase